MAYGRLKIASFKCKTVVVNNILNSPNLPGSSILGQNRFIIWTNWLKSSFREDSKVFLTITL